MEGCRVVGCLQPRSTGQDDCCKIGRTIEISVMSLGGTILVAPGELSLGTRIADLAAKASAALGKPCQLCMEIEC